ncbi:MAG: TlpA family protein disulfide reductase [Deltaproteobacteria bacterium]|nr:MAG: TlpA family protein disulfide reductase [Deltaproteobacteria bacterium]
MRLIKDLSIGFVIPIIFLTLLNNVSNGASNAPIVGSQLPETTLPIPDNPDEMRYLGLTGKGSSFQIPQIKAKVVVIEIFSMYCPHCQREAPEVNKLYSAIENDQDLKGKIKLIGIGVGNSPFEVEVFKKKYDVPFPLFPDEDFSIHKCFGETRTPYFIAIKINDDGAHKVIYSQLGGMKGVEQFLKKMTQLSGLE